MTVTMLLDLGSVRDETGAERTLGRYDLSGFSFAYSPEEDAERPIALQGQLSGDTDTALLEGLRDRAVPIPDASLSLSLPQEGGGTARPLVDLTLSQVRIDSVGQGRLVLRGAQVTAGSAAGLVGGLAEASAAAQAPAPAATPAADTPANAAPEPEAVVPTPTETAGDASAYEEAEYEDAKGAHAGSGEGVYPEEPYSDATLARTEAPDPQAETDEAAEREAPEAGEDGLAIERQPPAVT